ncbi:hypothetical protein GEMRC1_012103 [Eukaryota sp. GEM-RC1]
MTSLSQSIEKQQHLLCPPSGYDVQRSTSREIACLNPPSSFLDDLSECESFTKVYSSTPSELNCTKIETLSTPFLEFLQAAIPPKPVCAIFVTDTPSDTPSDIDINSFFSDNLPFIVFISSTQLSFNDVSTYNSQSLEHDNFFLQFFFLSQSTTPDTHLISDLWTDQDLLPRAKALLKRSGSKFNDITRYLDSNHTLPDHQIFDHLHHLIHAPDFTPCRNVVADPNDGRSISRAKTTLCLVPRHFSLKEAPILDIGCAEGGITGALGIVNNTLERNTHGCDVRDIGYSKGFVFSRTNGTTLPYDDNSFGIVTCLMCLHHVETPEVLFKEVFRVLKPEGVFIIREHDLKNENYSKLFDFQHGLYDLVWSNPRDDPNWISTFSAFYKSRARWIELIEGHGFLLERTDDISQENARKRHESKNSTPHNPFCSFTLLFVKERRRETRGGHGYRRRRY